LPEALRNCIGNVFVKMKPHRPQRLHHVSFLVAPGRCARA
jgi:hypothetical protein